MEIQKIIKLLSNKPNQTSKFRIKTWVKINNDSPCITPIVKLSLRL